MILPSLFVPHSVNQHPVSSAITACGRLSGVRAKSLTCRSSSTRRMLPRAMSADQTYSPAAAMPTGAAPSGSVMSSVSPAASLRASAPRWLSETQTEPSRWAVAIAVCAIQWDGEFAADSVSTDHGELISLRERHQRTGAVSRDAVRPTWNVDEVQPITARDDGDPICAGDRAPGRFGGHGELSGPLTDGEPALAPVRGPPYELSGIDERDPHVPAGPEGNGVWTGHSIVEHRNAVCSDRLSRVSHVFIRLSSSMAVSSAGVPAMIVVACSVMSSIGQSHQRLDISR